MKIYFGLGMPPDPVTFSNDWQVIKASQQPTPTFRQYQIFKCLERNQPFWNEIVKSRKRLGIPDEGLEWEYARALEYMKEYGDYLTEERMARFDHSELFTKVYDEQQRIQRKFMLHHYVNEYLFHLIRSNYIFLMPIEAIYTSYMPLDNDEIEDIDEVEGWETVQISVSEQITKNQLLKFIQDNWNELAKEIDKLPSTNTSILSGREELVLELRDGKHLSFPQIADQIASSTDDRDGTINQDSVKTAYHRALDKITAIATPRCSNLRHK